MRRLMIPAVVLLAACSSSTDPAPAPVDYRVEIQTGGSTVYQTFMDQQLVAVVRQPNGEYARDVTVKWEGDTGIYAAETTTGPDSATGNLWTVPSPTAGPYDAHMRACATDPVSRTCTVYSGTITLHLQ